MWLHLCKLSVCTVCKSLTLLTPFTYYGVPRHRLTFTEPNVGLLSLLFYFADCDSDDDESVGAAPSVIDDDSDDEDTCTIKRLVLRSTASFAAFASFHELQSKGAAIPGACQAAKVLTGSSSEVAVMVPPLSVAGRLLTKAHARFRSTTPTRWWMPMAGYATVARIASSPSYIFHTGQCMLVQSMLLVSASCTANSMKSWPVVICYCGVCRSSMVQFKDWFNMGRCHPCRQKLAADGEA